MPTFAGVTFSIRWDDFVPLLDKHLYISVEHYPETDTDEIQTGGVGNGRFTLPTFVASLTDLNTLRSAMRLGTVGTLTGSPEGTLTNMKLAGIGNPRLAPDGRVLADLDFLET